MYGTAGRFRSQFESECLYQVYNKDKIVRASQRKAVYSSFDESGKHRCKNRKKMLKNFKDNVDLDIDVRHFAVFISPKNFV